MQGPLSSSRYKMSGIEPEAAMVTDQATAIAVLQMDREQLSWAVIHGRDLRRRLAQQAQITTHHDLNGGREAIGQQLAWARRQAHEKQVHASAMTQLRHRHSSGLLTSDQPS